MEEFLKRLSLIKEEEIKDFEFMGAVTFLISSLN